jgi:hypothetical protein
MRGNARRVVGCMVTLGLLLFLVGCSRGRTGAILNLVPLQKQLVAEYGASNIVIGLQEGDMLEVTVIDDSSSAPARARSVEQAREIAEFVCQHYGSMDKIDRVSVALEIRQEGFVADVTGVTRFSFEKGELECGEG